MTYQEEKSKQEAVKKFIENLPYHCTAEAVSLALFDYLEEKKLVKFKRGQKRSIPLRPFLTKDIDSDVERATLATEFLQHYKNWCELVNSEACDWTKPEIQKAKQGEEYCMTGQELAIIAIIPQALSYLLDGQE